MQESSAIKITRKVDFLKNLRAEYPLFESDGTVDTDCMNRFSQKLISEVKNFCSELEQGKTYCLSYQCREDEEKLTVTFNIRLRQRGESPLIKKIKVTWENGFITGFET